VNTLCAYVCREIQVKRSRFIAEAFPVTTQVAARETLKTQKTRYADASHVVHAFIAGPQGEVRGMSDDGEPPRTAARPVMDVLTGKGCTNILLTVTRYFGGTLLGVGGLVKAYGDAAKAALEAAVLNPLIPQCRFSVTVPYGLYPRAERFLSTLPADGLQTDFGTTVAVAGVIPQSEKSVLEVFFRNLTGGNAEIRVMPLD
jgi:uncharacterized YigZ family protein